MTKIYLDDERNPKHNIDSWVIIRSYNELVTTLRNIELPISEISFDHDLGEEKTGLDCLRYLIELDMNSDKEILSKDCIYNFHTANPCGRDNMKGRVQSYLKFKN